MHCPVISSSSSSCHRNEPELHSLTNLTQTLTTSYSLGQWVLVSVTKTLNILFRPHTAPLTNISKLCPLCKNVFLELQLLERTPTNQPPSHPPTHQSFHTHSHTQHNPFSLQLLCNDTKGNLTPSQRIRMKNILSRLSLLSIVNRNESAKYVSVIHEVEERSAFIY